MSPQARLGAFVLIAFIVLGVVSSKIGGQVWFKQKSHVVEAVFDDLLGLEVQAPVRMAGVKVGIVQDILLRNNRAVVRIALGPDVRLPASTRAFIASRGMVGEKYLGLRAEPNDKEWLPDGAIIPSEEGGDINVLFNKLEDVAEDIGSLSKGLNELLGDKEATASIKIMLANVGEAARRLSAILAENHENLGKLVANLKDGSDSIRKNLPATLAQAQRAARGIADFVGAHRDDLSRAAKALPEAVASGNAFFGEGEKTMANVNAVIADNRENLYRMLFEFRKAAENLEELSDDLRRNPWKLTVKQPEVPPGPRAEQEKMEEMLLTTGHMGLTPARR